MVIALTGAVAASGAAPAQPPPATSAACPRVLVPSAGFTDTTRSAVEAEIDCVVWWGLAGPTSPRHFSPKGTIGRASVASLLLRLIGRSDGLARPAAVRHARAVRPNAAITRSEMAVLLDSLRRSYGSTATPIGRTFSDVPPTHARFAAIERLVAAGVIEPAPRFRPGARLTRASMAAWVARLAGLAVTAGKAELPVGLNPRSSCARPAPTTAAGYQAMFDRRWGGWGGADGAQSIPLPDGRTMWQFNDTLQGRPTAGGAWKDGWRLIRNSVLIQDRGCLFPLLGRNGGETIPVRPDGEFYWPGNGILDGDRIYAHAWRLRQVDQPLFEFEIVGSYLAVYDVPAPGRQPRFVEAIPTPTSDWTAPGPKVGWGTALWSDGTFAYVYGIRGRASGLGNELHVARVPLGQIANLGAWQFRTDRGWSGNPLLSTNRITDGTYLEGFSIGPWGDGVVIVSKEDGFFGDEIRTWTAPSPSGPFTRRRKLPLPARNTERYWYYTANHHPQIQLESGRTLASVSRNTDDWETLLGDARLYKPQFRGVVMPELRGAARPAPLAVTVEVGPAPLRAPTTLTVVVSAAGRAAPGRPVQVRSDGRAVGVAHTDASGIARIPVASVPADLIVRVRGATGQPDATARATIVPTP